MNSTRTDKKNQTQTAAQIIKTFILSKRSTKKIFGLNLARQGLLRYLGDSMDLNFNKTKKLQTKLYESQICRHCHCDPKTLRLNRSILIRKKFIKFDAKKRLYSLGLILNLWGVSPVCQEVGRNSRHLRSREKLPISNSSDITNKGLLPVNQKPNSKTWDGMAPTAPTVSALLDEYLNKKETH